MNKIKKLLESTDLYLKILKETRIYKNIDNENLEIFKENIKNSYKILQELNVFVEHKPYIIRTLTEMSNYTDDIDDLFLYESEEELENNIQDDDIDNIVNSTTWEDIIDLYNEDELVYDPNPDDNEEIEESISATSRLRKSMSLRRRNTRVSLARNLKLKRASSVETLKKRAILAARRAVYKKLLMGRDKSSLSASEKDRLEKRVSNLKFIQSSLAIKLLPKIKQIEQKRLAHRVKR